VQGLRLRSTLRFGRTAFNRRLAVDSLDERIQLLASLKPAMGRLSSVVRKVFHALDHSRRRPNRSPLPWWLRPAKAKSNAAASAPAATRADSTWEGLPPAAGRTAAHRHRRRQQAVAGGCHHAPVKAEV